MRAAAASRVQAERVYRATDLPGTVRAASQRLCAREAAVAIAAQTWRGARVSFARNREAIVGTPAGSVDARAGGGATTRGDAIVIRGVRDSASSRGAAAGSQADDEGQGGSGARCGRPVAEAEPHRATTRACGVAGVDPGTRGRSRRFR